MANRIITAEHLREQARELFAERGDDMTLFQFCEAVGVCPTTVEKRLGCWSAFRISLGLRPRARINTSFRKYTHEIIVERLRHTARKDPMITQAEFTRWTGITAPTVTRYFGSWARLREHADLPSGRRKRPGFSEEALMQEFNRVVIELSRLPRGSTEFCRWSRISKWPYVRAYQNWKGIVAAYKAYLYRIGQGRPGVACDIPDTRSLY
jgi:hypothetical protein